jgi:hypothetical protein
MHPATHMHRDVRVLFYEHAKESTKESHHCCYSNQLVCTIKANPDPSTCNLKSPFTVVHTTNHMRLDVPHCNISTMLRSSATLLNLTRHNVQPVDSFKRMLQTATAAARPPRSYSQPPAHHSSPRSLLGSSMLPPSGSCSQYALPSCTAIASITCCSCWMCASSPLPATASGTAGSTGDSNEGPKRGRSAAAAAVRRRAAARGPSTASGRSLPACIKHSHGRTGAEGESCCNTLAAFGGGPKHAAEGRDTKSRCRHTHLDSAHSKLGLLQVKHVLYQADMQPAHHTVQ